MTEPSITYKDTLTSNHEDGNDSVTLDTSASSSVAGKRSAAIMFEDDHIEDLKDKETTLDDVLLPSLVKKKKLLDEGLPDVDDNEIFPQQHTEEMDEDLEIDPVNSEHEFNMNEESQLMPLMNQEVVEKDVGIVNQQDVDELAPSDEDEEASEVLITSQTNDVDIVDVDEEEAIREKEEYEPSSEEEDEDALETARAIARAQNQREARQLLLQLDNSTRSKLCLTALKKYGEELFYGHEDARDAILVDACAQDSVLSLMRDAIRVKDLYLRGSSAAAPLELDDDDDEDEEDQEEEEEEEDQEGEDEVGGYEDEEEDADDEEEKSTGSTEDHDDEVVVISEVEEGDGADSEAVNSTASSPGSDVHPSKATYPIASGANGEEIDVGLKRRSHPDNDISCDTDTNEGYGGDYSEQGTMEGDVGATSDSASGLLIDDERP